MNIQRSLYTEETESFECAGESESDSCAGESEYSFQTRSRVIVVWLGETTSAPKSPTNF